MADMKTALNILRGFSFMARTSSGDLNLASLHRKDRMCWSWAVTLRKYRGDEARRFALYRIPGFQERFVLATPWRALEVVVHHDMMLVNVA
ncbi:hypothetical protein [Microvirga mediterraneensis]|uniref:Uncharacterized protein n=1 Tax=Microvirga mediterraneensis TaxID=2754695 RepID=A0A838BS14_9HYPH|nr:hypothetical protein [Microvirga mediterraneensis]MBA1157772.1 hypothetical protein [Microvirga mediterraneensis]